MTSLGLCLGVVILLLLVLSLVLYKAAPVAPVPVRKEVQPVPKEVLPVRKEVLPVPKEVLPVPKAPSSAAPLAARPHSRGTELVFRRRVRKAMDNTVCTEYSKQDCPFWANPKSYHRDLGRFPDNLTWTPEGRLPVYCIVLREYVRQVDVSQPNCHFIDFVPHLGRAVLNPEGKLLPYTGCWEYSRFCHQHKLLLALRHLQSLPPVYEYFFLVDADNIFCVSLDVISQLAYAYRPYLLMTGMGTSGWLFDRAFLQNYTKVLAEFEVVDNCPYCPDFLVAKKFQGCWLVSRLHLVQHIAGNQRLGLNQESVEGDRNKHLPRCLSMPTQWGFWAFGCYDMNACGDSDTFPCFQDYGVLRNLFVPPSGAGAFHLT